MMQHTMTLNSGNIAVMPTSNVSICGVDFPCWPSCMARSLLAICPPKFDMAMKLHENYLQWMNPLVIFDCLLGIQIYSALPGSPQNLWFILNLPKEAPKIENNPFIDSRSSGFPIEKTKASHLQQILRLTPCANSPPAPRVSARICHTFSQFSAKPPREVVAQISSRDHMAQADRM